ncbi:MAG: type II secretion system major pseudopilin GspG [Deltaproteobacteria bacterium]|jgi:general secretion pathway protein G|nr:type II secretion system major pseudopilin GspG [Deltaproteobacteria bacterium]MCW8893280.1 type II secretion system major pseudopilin GspG [Deltaproteobacteria bacterium]MCW9050314.1 type II secretion system major pseudopilin GspG [Deltaproteobacteria bacterium]
MKKNYRDIRGFTLIEIMVVVVILGILASIVVPKLLSRPDQAKITKAQLDIKGLEESLGMFKLDNGFYPTTEQGLGALVSIPSVGRIPTKYPEGGYLKKVPQDPWEGQYLYLSPGLHSNEYDIISYGADGEPGGEGFDADINSWDI